MQSAPFWHQVAFWAAAAGLVWNFANTVRTEVLQRRNRLRATKLEEFRSQIREPISSALQELGAIKREVQGLSLSATDVKERKELLIEINRTFAVKAGELQDALANANASKFTSGEHWQDGIEDHLDQCLTLIDRAAAPTRPSDDFGIALNLLIQSIATIIAVVNERTEAEVHRITSEKPKSPKPSKSN